MENITLKQSWTERNLPKLAKAAPEVAAPILDRHVRWMEARDKRIFLEWGLCFLMVEERELWRHLCDAQGAPYRGFDHWVISAAPYGRATAYEAKGSVKALREIPMAELSQVPRANIKVLRMLPAKGKSDPESLLQPRRRARSSSARRLGRSFPTRTSKPWNP